MKIGIVPASLLSRGGHRLDADHYLLPTAALEKELARKKKALATTQTAVMNLETKIDRRKEALCKAGVVLLPEGGHDAVQKG